MATLSVIGREKDLMHAILSISVSFWSLTIACLSFKERHSPMRMPSVLALLSCVERLMARPR